MIALSKNIIEIAKSALNIECTIDTDIDWKELSLYAKKLKIMPLIYYGLINAGVEMPPDISNVFFKNTALNLAVSNKQLFELERIKQAFLDNKIDFIVLKGATIKKYYPTPEMRPMGDVDMLIKQNQYSKIRSIMQNLGFEDKGESNYEYKWSKGNVLVELHKRLTAPTNRDFCRYYDDGWKRVMPVAKTSEYIYSKEDYFVYLFMHFSRHYRDAGIGILHLIDIYLYLKNNRALDESYLINELEKLKLAEFYKNIKHTINACFEDGEVDDKVELIIDRIISNGSYGNATQSALSKAAKNIKDTKNKVRTTLLVKRIFMPYKEMCIRHKILEKAPVLLPFFWIYRVFDVLFIRRERLKKEMYNFKLAKPEEVIKFYDELNKVGLSFDFDD